MKRTNMILLAVILMVSFQSYSQERLGYNFLAGYSNSYFGNLFQPKGGNGGLFLGGGVSYSFFDSFKLSGEVAYHQLSGNESSTIILANRFGLSESKITLHTLEGTLLGKWNPYSLGQVKINLLGGASAAYNLTTWERFNLQLNYDNVAIEVSGQENVSSEYLKWHYGVWGGFGFEVPVEGILSSLGMEIRYRYGLNEMRSGSTEILQQQTEDVKPNSLLAVLLFSF